ncbi:MAG: hypothetical protein J2P57_25525, partial [Acidimicrobiaceae bacterium]|nr:hypothetical protein [Acidimicrobiaceae bacterium]
APERLWACHSSLRTLAAWRAQAEDIRLVLSTRRDRLGNDAAARARAAGVDAINLRLTDWTTEAVAEVHDEGLRAFGWDAQSERALAAAVALGLDGVYSDHVRRMMQALTADQAGER